MKPLPGLRLLKLLAASRRNGDGIRFRIALRRSGLIGCAGIIEAAKEAEQKAIEEEARICVQVLRERKINELCRFVQKTNELFVNGDGRRWRSVRPLCLVGIVIGGYRRMPGRIARNKD